MNKFGVGAITIGVCLAIGIGVGWSGATEIGIGNVGIVKHMDGQITELPQGVHWTGWGVAVQEYPTYTQSLVLSDKNTEGGSGNGQWQVGTSDQQEMPVNTSLTWKINTKDASNLYQSVGGKDVQYITDSIVEPTMKNVVNRITHDYTWNDIKGAKQGEVTDKINQQLKADLTKYGVEIGRFGFTFVGSPQGMASSQQSLATSELKVKQAQADQDRIKIENQTTILQAQTAAQAAQIKAEGEAKANEELAKSITPDLIEYNKITKWNGANPTTVLGSGTSTMVQVK